MGKLKVFYHGLHEVSRQILSGGIAVAACTLLSALLLNMISTPMRLDTYNVLFLSRHMFMLSAVVFIEVVFGTLFFNYISKKH